MLISIYFIYHLYQYHLSPSKHLPKHVQKKWQCCIDDEWKVLIFMIQDRDSMIIGMIDRADYWYFQSDLSQSTSHISHLGLPFLLISLISYLVITTETSKGYMQYALHKNASTTTQILAKSINSEMSRHLIFHGKRSHLPRENSFFDLEGVEPECHD